MYAALERIKDWRKKLSNFATVYIKHHGYTFSNVEAAYQSSKFADTHPEVAHKFADGGEFSEALAARKAHRCVPLTKQELAEFEKRKPALW